MGLQSTSLLLFLFFRFCSSIDTISGNQSIKEGDLLVSSGQTFALGFFGPRNSSSQRYVGIWYHKISERTIVWVANRDNPINGTSGILSISKDGNLVLRDQKQSGTIPVWQTNVRTAQKTTNFSAQLLDSGNLVLAQGGDSGGSGSVVVAWQSFDYPTHAFLSGMKLGLDRRTGLDRFLTSWKSSYDPGAGESSYRMDPGGVPQLVLRKGRVKRWRSGPWLGHKWSGIPEMVTKNYIFNVSYIDNEDEVSVAYSLINDSNLSIEFLDEFGYLKRVNWDDSNSRWVEFWSIPKDRCDYYGRCGVFGNCGTNTATEFGCTCLPGYGPSSAGDESTGCARKSLLRCGKEDGFVKVGGVKIPDTSEARALTRLGVKECKEECLRNCSCSAYTSDGEGGGKCIMWYGNLTDTKEFTYGSFDLYIRVGAAESGEQSKKQRNFQGRMVSIVVPSVVVSLLTISLLCWLLLKRKRESNIQLRDEENQDFHIFDMVTVTKATNKFSETNKIGEGGFGCVYKGQLPTGEEIAVKRLSVNSMQGVNEFKNEVILIAKLQHRNLVRLLGCCIHGDERMLIYEYMSNGSLDSFIFGEESKQGNLLTWRKRLDIIIGIARGLLYLHQDSRLRVIHRDLKASNILLDCDMNPKISDFGLARVFGGDQSSAITRRVVGTYGYMSPEYAIDGLFSTKSDIFSFGVIILEILSGKKNRLFNHRSHDLNLLGHAWKLWMEGKASELLDTLVEDSCPPLSELIRFIQVGLLCVQKFQENRPTMSSVLLMLITGTAILPQPKEPGFYTERNPNNRRHYYPLPGNSSSNNDMTVTQLEAR